MAKLESVIRNMEGARGRILLSVEVELQWACEWHMLRAAGVVMIVRIYV